MNVLIVTSCTGRKRVSDPHQLTLADFRRGRDHVAARETELAHALTAASELYTGPQHQRLLRGIDELRSSSNARPTVKVDLRIVSAGYGVITSDDKIAPYEATFSGMPKSELREWSQTLRLQDALAELLKGPYDVALILLGSDYLTAVNLSGIDDVRVPTIVFCSLSEARKVPETPTMRVVALGNDEARRFSCPLVALKGELARRMLARLSDESLALTAHNLLEQLESPSRNESVTATPSDVAEAESKADWVVSLAPSWWERRRSHSLHYFIPEWDDLVDADFDFRNDRHSSGRGDWSKEVYAHQLYPEPNYDGILVSRVVYEKSKNKKARIDELGIHRFLRVPVDFPVMGDCGAFGYIGDAEPPYSTPEVIEYYTRLGFDFGVSIDHLIVSGTMESREQRYELTITNAGDFIRLHRAEKLPWEPVGAVQGWDPQSYAAAARQYVAMGYRYIGLGGLVRTPTAEVLRIFTAVREVVPREVQVHLFGLARLRQAREMARLGVSSVDSASALRRAWLGSGKNYLSTRGEWFTAIRIPEAGKSFRAKRMVVDGRANADQVKRLEQQCLRAMRDFDSGKLSVEKTVDVIDEYDQLITPDRASNRDQLERTLTAEPWRACPCAVCAAVGIEVIIFRGNNRNRRRGFHNTYVFSRLLERVLNGEDPIGLTGHQLFMFSE